MITCVSPEFLAVAALVRVNTETKTGQKQCRRDLRGAIKGLRAAKAAGAVAETVIRRTCSICGRCKGI